jgi:hypothetical protein
MGRSYKVGERDLLSRLQSASCIVKVERVFYVGKNDLRLLLLSRDCIGRGERIIVASRGFLPQGSTSSLQSW